MAQVATIPFLAQIEQIDRVAESLARSRQMNNHNNNQHHMYSNGHQQYWNNRQNQQQVQYIDQYVNQEIESSYNAKFHAGYGPITKRHYGLNDHSGHYQSTFQRPSQRATLTVANEEPEFNLPTSSNSIGHREPTTSGPGFSNPSYSSAMPVSFLGPTTSYSASLKPNPAMMTVSRSLFEDNSPSLYSSSSSTSLDSQAATSSLNLNMSLKKSTGFCASGTANGGNNSMFYPAAQRQNPSNLWAPGVPLNLPSATSTGKLEYTR
ncbi:hypothetical protein CANCADRAFT_32464 [Tortispora caseinolytica NRRL Y-17796]|uniref:Uncharacterized protein n=1 Tax=Tortispora caseinolytica NRRL Y-17796 TaxID=767744 RepID=A0A1E4TBH7_9ASCO|nr:hypothetical protein CANCADRAFT_32464 [Tortispora caseinolytica NRRL Y-17796]